MFKPMNAAQERIHSAALRLFADKGNVQLTVKELADAAGVARGTVYNNFESVERLYEKVATRLANEMHERVVTSFGSIEDPVRRLSAGIRSFVRRAHEEPHWGRFLTRFAASDATLQGLLAGPPMKDLQAGLERGRLVFRAELLPGVLALLAGGVQTSMFLVLEGHRTWRDAGSDMAELFLRAVGMPPEEARSIATAELAPLSPVEDRYA